MHLLQNQGKILIIRRYVDIYRNKTIYIRATLLLFAWVGKCCKEIRICHHFFFMHINYLWMNFYDISRHSFYGHRMVKKPSREQRTHTEAWEVKYVHCMALEKRLCSENNFKIFPPELFRGARNNFFRCFVVQNLAAITICVETNKPTNFSLNVNTDHAVSFVFHFVRCHFSPLVKNVHMSK